MIEVIEKLAATSGILFIAVFLLFKLTTNDAEKKEFSELTFYELLVIASAGVLGVSSIVLIALVFIMHVWS